MSRDWQKDMELLKEAEEWEFDPTSNGEGNIVKDTTMIAENIGISYASTIFNVFEALPHWLKEVKGLCEVNQQSQREILSLRIRLSAEKERADKLQEENKRLKKILKSIEDENERMLNGEGMEAYEDALLAVLEGEEAK